MLNELRLIAEALRRCQQTVPREYPYLRSMPNAVTYVLRVGQGGTVVSCEERSPEQIRNAALKRIESGGGGTSFPGFNFRRFTAKGKVDTTFWKCWREFPENLKGCFSNCPPEFRAFEELVRRCVKRSVTEDQIRDSIDHAFKIAHKEGKLSRRGWKQFQDLADRQKGKPISVFLEVNDSSSFDWPVATPKTIAFINERLLERKGDESFATGGKGAEKKSGQDAYGDSGDIQTRFPEAGLPVIGKVVLFSMTSDSPCQSRYGAVESGLFPVVKPTATAMKNALAWMTSPAKKGRTWSDVPGQKLVIRNGRRRRQNDLLISYCEAQPESEGTFARFFGDLNRQVATETFELACQSVIAALNGIPQRRMDSAVRVVVLAKADQGRTKVVLSESYTVQAIEAAAQWWSLASQNIPQAALLLPIEQGKPAQGRPPTIPFPGQVVRCLNKEWVQEASRSEELHGCSLVDVHQLMIWHDAETARKLLELAVRRFMPLISAIRHGQHRGKEIDIPVMAREDTLTAVCVLGILLLAFQRRKEEYMSASPFQIGHLLSLVDQLHKLYSEEVRKSLPNRLLGNTVLATALNQPNTALALLSQRLLPYKAWADTVSVGEKVGLARWFSKELGRVSTDIHTNGIPEQLTNSGRAEMLLGYLAGKTKEDKS